MSTKRLVQLNAAGEAAGGLAAYRAAALPPDRQAEEHARLLRAVRGVVAQGLTDRQRQVVGLYYYDNLTMAAIARQLNVNKSTVCRILQAARRRIERHLNCLL